MLLSTPSRTPPLAARQATASTARQTVAAAAVRPRRAAAVAVRAAGEVATAAEPASAPASDSGNWTPVVRPEDLPKGTRREVKVDGISVLLFWYRSAIYAIENRSPAEGAYSEGFANARLTQDACIECPSTKSLFSLNTGEVTAWYPTNPVLRALTPKDTVRPLRIFPVKLGQDAISVDVSSATGGEDVGPGGPAGRGGADSSLESNNVFATQPRVYVEGEDTPGGGGGGLDAGALATGAVTLAALAGAGAAGTAVALYVDAPRALIAAVWVAVAAGGAAALRSGKE